jgi:L-rhamnose mutarotase
MGIFRIRGVVELEHRAYLMRLKPDMVKDYVDIHKKEKIWSSITDGLKKAGFKKMIIFQLGTDIILFEEAVNLQSAYTYLSNDAESVRWDTMISEWMEEYPQFNEIKGDIEFTEIPVVFYFDRGKLLHA